MLLIETSPSYDVEERLKRSAVSQNIFFSDKLLGMANTSRNTRRRPRTQQSHERRKKPTLTLPTILRTHHHLQRMETSIVHERDGKELSNYLFRRYFSRFASDNLSIAYRSIVLGIAVAFSSMNRVNVFSSRFPTSLNIQPHAL